MKNVLVYSLALVIATAPLLINTACNKSSSDSSDLVGNWAIGDFYDGAARSEAVMFQIADTVYVGTGLSDIKRFADFYRYSLNAKSWTKISDFSGGVRSSAIAFALGNRGYVGTGYDSLVTYRKDMWEYKADSNVWRQKNDFGGSARVDAVAFVANGNGYVATGYDDSYLKDVWQYNQAADSWSQKAGITGAKRKEAATFTINGKVYLISGNNNGSATNDMQSYDAGSDTWTPLRKLTNTSDDAYDDKYTSIIRYNAAAFVMNGKGYLATGENGSLNTRTWEYDANADQWTEKTAFSGTARTGAIGFSLANGTRGFVVAGRSGTQPFDNMYEFQPDIADDDNDNQ